MCVPAHQGPVAFAGTEGFGVRWHVLYADVLAVLHDALSILVLRLRVRRLILQKVAATEQIEVIVQRVYRLAIRFLFELEEIIDVAKIS